MEITVRKGNVELTVPAEQKDRYLKLGYSVYEGDKVVEEAFPDDVEVLKAKIIALMDENAELKKKLEAKPKTTKAKVETKEDTEK